MAEYNYDVGSDITGYTDQSTELGNKAVFNTYYEVNRMQQLIKASQLTDIGLLSGDEITDVGLRVAVVPPDQDVVNYRIYIGHSSLTALTGWVDYSNLTNCYGPTTIARSSMTANTFVTKELTTSFTWNGSSSLIMDFSRTDTAWKEGGSNHMSTANSTNWNDQLASARNDNKEFPFTDTPTIDDIMLDIYFTVNRTDPVTNTNERIMLGFNF